MIFDLDRKLGPIQFVSLALGRILDKAFCISHSANTLGKSMHPIIILSPVIGL